MRLGTSEQLSFQIDVLLCEANTGRTLAVLDTKYKASELPSEEDIKQVIAYAAETGVSSAYLVYPSALSEPIDLPPTTWRKIRIRSVVFDLGVDSDEAGAALLQQIGDGSDSGRAETAP